MDEHVPAPFQAVVAAFGHRVISVQEAGLARSSDGDLLRALPALQFDLRLTLDGRRQPEVWSDLYGALAEGTGRLLRIKIRQREVPTVAVLTRAWAGPYEALALLLDDSSRVLIQLGLDTGSQRRLRGGVRAYIRAQVADLLQQEMSIGPGNALRAPGTPRPRGRR